MSVINAVTNTTVKTIPVGAFPTGVVFGGSLAYVAGGDGITVINAANDSLIGPNLLPLAPISLGSVPVGLALSRDDSRLYVSHGANSVSVIVLAAMLARFTFRAPRRTSVRVRR